MTLTVPEKILMIRSRLLTHGVMILAVMAALLLTPLLQPVLEPSVFTLFYAAVAVSAWYGGIVPGVLAIALSVVVALYFLIEPVYSFEIISLSILVRCITFSLVSLLITILSSELRTARRKAEKNLKLLQNSKMRFSRLLESNIIGVIVTDINGSIIEANDAFLKMVGYTQEDLSTHRMNWREMTPPEHLHLSESSVQELKTTGICQPFEKEYIRKNGSRVPVLLGSAFVGDSEATFIGFVVDLSDRQAALRERKQAEAALQQANQQITRTLETMSDAFVALDRDWQIIYQNAEAERINGKPRIEIIGKSHWEEWPASVGTNIEHQYRRAMAEQIPLHFEHHYYFPPKHNQWFEIHAYPFEDGLNIFFRDISKNKLAEQTLQEKEERLRLANERFELAAAAVNCLIYDWNIEQDNVERTEGLTRILGYSLTEAQPTSSWWRELVHPEDLQRTQDGAIVALANGDRYVNEYRVRHKDNQYIYVLDQGIVVQRDANGQPIRIVGSTTDISERKQVEEALQEQEKKYRYIFEATGVSIFEQDFSLVKAALDDLKTQGVQNFRTFFAEHPDFIQQAVGMVRIVNANNAAVQMFGAQEKNDLLTSLHQIFLPETLEVFVKELLAITDEQTYLESETILQTLQGERLNIIFTITFPPPATKFDSVLVSIMNITAHKQAEATVKDSEEKLKSFVEANVVGILFGDVDGGISEANDEFLRIVGYTREDLQAGRLCWIEMTPPEYLYLDELAIAEAKAKGACTPYEKQYIRKDGSRIPVVIGYTLLGAARHKSVAFILDISEQQAALRDRQQIEKALRQSEKQFQAFMDNSPAPAWITDADGCVLYLSQTYLRTFDLSTNKPIGKNIFELYPAQIAQPFFDNIRKVAETNQVVEAIKSAPRTDGTIGEFLVYQFPIADASEHQLVGGVAIDITERERALRERQLAEQALQERSERLKLLSETASDLLSTERPLDLMNSLFSKLSAQMDLDFYFHYLIDTHENKQRLRLVSWSGITDEVFQEIEYLEFNERMCGVVAEERRQMVVNDVLHSTHPRAHILCSLKITAYAGQPLIAQGKLLGVLSFASLSRTHFTPEEIALMQATSDQVAIALERAELMASLQRRKEQLIQANRIKDEFLAVLSHELRTPLNPILGWSKLLRTKKYDQATTDRALETIERNAKLQTQLIEDLLDVSRILQGKLSLNVSPVNLTSMIAAAIETVRLAAEAKSIHLQTVFEPNIAKVAGDSNRLQQVVWNLVSNAIKFTPQGGQVEISLASSGSQAQLQVRDTGKGISLEFLPYVFDYFRQADGATTRKFGGLGLGLAIVRHIVELHGGTVKAESLGEEQGATFTVLLPLMKVDSKSHEIDRQPDDSPHLNGLKVLLVDDEDDTRDLIAFILKQSGAEVIQVASAMEALRVIPQFQPHLLLSDIGMPEVDGYMLMRQIRAMLPEQGGQIPAIALTAYAGEVDYQQAIAAGFQQHITKPVEPAKLIRAIANLIDGHSNLQTSLQQVLHE
ncbi:hybrid sensor histidine kinase/response regulator [aff. Roholtiella sp. LEGE 12411]|uniref:hybrid sensor histidine kinase/response regulator n=1 Tax=aff. Roholtiella sp. LEGE 12411 TaxID=1828822 RepID=UPI00187F5F31|nr:PAS domain S-box protein [aff. Roholtiella sp. LEGE 12411]MBE9035741.1 PAS domain S-box protein [aff. Roholtiella sp. LEGE 12411]